MKDVMKDEGGRVKGEGCDEGGRVKGVMKEEG
jgi:hypothetical protein